MNIKKMFLLATTVALMLNSCSNDDEILSGDKTGTAIEFRTVNDEKTTLRAAITDESNILSFTVSAWWTKGTDSTTESGYLFNGFGITRGEDATSKWIYTPLMYWPTGGSADFYAYSPSSSVNLTKGLTDYLKPSSSNNVITYKVPTIKENDAQEDFLVAKAIGKNEVPSVGNTTANPVILNFHHALSRIKFFAKTTSKDMTYLINEISLVNLFEEGSLNLSTTTLPETGGIDYTNQFQPWATTGNKVNYVADMGASPIKLIYDEFSSLLGKTNAILVMPQTTIKYAGTGTSAPTGGQFAIKVLYQAYAGDIYYAGSADDQTAERYFLVNDPRNSANPITFEMGRQYAFYLVFGDDAGEKIDFSVAVQDWDTTANVELP